MSYHWHIENPKHFKYVVEEMTKATRIAIAKYDIEALGFAGISGASMAFPVAYALGLNVLCVRKPGERHHSDGDVIGWTPIKEDLRYAFMDDFISSGETYNRVVSAIGQAPKCIILRSPDMGDGFRAIPVIRVEIYRPE